MTDSAAEGDAVDRRMALAREWDDLVEQVRRLAGFEDFLRPPLLEALLPAAAKGPVVMVNVSRWRCDALIVRPDGVTVRELPDLSLADATERANTYLGMLQAAEAADFEHMEARGAAAAEPGLPARRRLRRAAQVVMAAQDDVNTMLTDLQGWLWDAVAEPVLDELGANRTPEGPTSTWPRVWWCPTGVLTVLPLHSACRRDGTRGDAPPRAVLDRVVSSYTPTLRALLEGRTPPDGSEGVESSCDLAAAGRLLLVQVDDAPGQPRLDGSRERAVLLDRIPVDRRMVLAGSMATRGAVLAVLPEHRWVHFTCHGDQDLRDPSRGGLLLHDEMLTIADITAGRFRGDFAGLSACKTAVGGIELLDEAITLAAALHYTGYRHVVAALWSVQDDASTEVFTRLYEEIVVDGRLEPDRAAVAVHDAVRDLRNRHPDWPHMWTPFTHTGP